jgi:predicted SAM-dependent methyltransferase
LQGYFNIDAVHNDKAPRPPDLLHEIKFDSAGNVENPIPLPDGCADELFAGHILEHVAEYEALSLVLEWKRLLKTGGRLILELPNIEAAARNLLAGMEPQMWRFAFYGDGSHKDPFMLHKFGYTPKSVKELVS